MKIKMKLKIKSKVFIYRYEQTNETVAETERMPVAKVSKSSFSAPVLALQQN